MVTGQASQRRRGRRRRDLLMSKKLCCRCGKNKQAENRTWCEDCFLKRKKKYREIQTESLICKG